MNPTIYREMRSGEILKEPIDITHEVTETTWEQNWQNYQPIAIVSPPQSNDWNLGYREACREVIAMVDEYFGDRDLERKRFCRKVIGMYNQRM